LSCVIDVKFYGGDGDAAAGERGETGSEIGWADGRGGGQAVKMKIDGM
jgi:hypothetical protein